MLMDIDGLKNSTAMNMLANWEEPMTFNEAINSRGKRRRKLPDNKPASWDTILKIYIYEFLKVNSNFTEESLRSAYNKQIKQKHHLEIPIRDFHSTIVKLCHARVLVTHKPAINAEDPVSYRFVDKNVLRVLLCNKAVINDLRLESSPQPNELEVTEMDVHFPEVPDQIMLDDITEKELRPSGRIKGPIVDEKDWNIVNDLDYLDGKTTVGPKWFFWAFIQKFVPIGTEMDCNSLYEMMVESTVTPIYINPAICSTHLSHYKDKGYFELVPSTGLSKYRYIKDLKSLKPSTCYYTFDKELFLKQHKKHADKIIEIWKTKQPMKTSEQEDTNFHNGQDNATEVPNEKEVRIPVVPLSLNNTMSPYAAFQWLSEKLSPRLFQSAIKHIEDLLEIESMTKVSISDFSEEECFDEGIKKRIQRTKGK